MTNSNRVPNCLVTEKSPYLLQHAYNPVDWYPWGEEAFDKAKRENKPIFLSIGYSTCHWCHVMERESFEDREVAEILNNNYIAIKVDREERPDVDSIYMTYCQALTGQGGWPLTIIMTPDKKPFFAGTYFPKKPRRGIPGFIEILEKINSLWKNSKSNLIASSEEILEKVKANYFLNEDGKLSKETVDEAFNILQGSFDSIYGGFGSAPKFPIPHNLMFLLRYSKAYNSPKALEMVEKTLHSMYQGGIYDHIGFGFSRYSTDNKWLVPHFEKMLYDNALLSFIYLEAYQATGNKLYAQIAQDIFAYVLRDMTDKEGGFYSAEDADSEGIEGKFYVWTPEEIKEILGEADGELICSKYDIKLRGNFEGKSIPNLINQKLSTEKDTYLDSLLHKLFLARKNRIPPYKDDKILTSWNGLMIAGLSYGGRILKNKDYIAYAEKTVNFIFNNLYYDNRLYARYRGGERKYYAYIDDYAFLAWGLIELYQANYEPQYLEKALKLTEEMLALFWDDNQGGFYLYGNDSEELIARPKEIYDGAQPSGNSVAALNLLRLASLTGNVEYEEKANIIFESFGGTISQNPSAFAFALCSWLFNVSGTKEALIVGSLEEEQTIKFIDTLNRSYQPFMVSLVYSRANKNELEKLVGFINQEQLEVKEPCVYLCENFACHAPTSSLDNFSEIINI